MVRRMTLPSLTGVRPRSRLHDRLLDRLDRALVVGRDREQAGLAGGDVGELVERGLSAVVVDDDAVQQLRGRAPGADSRELAADGLDGLRHALIGVLQELVNHVVDDRSDTLPGHYPLDVPLVIHVEDVDGQRVVHAQRQRGRVHDREAALDRLVVGDLGDELGFGVGARIRVVDAVDAVLRHQQRVSVDLERAQGRRGIGGEERVAGAGREDHDAPLLQVADRAAADVGLGDLGDRDR